MSRTILIACASSSARWSATPETRVCTSAPPSSSAETSTPVAAFTRGGPPMKIVPWPFTITVSSLMAGGEGPPPAVRAPPRADRGGGGGEKGGRWLEKRPHGG